MINKERHNCNDCIKENVCEWAVYSDVINCNKFVDKQVLKRPQGYWIDKGLYNECSECKMGYMKSIIEKCIDSYTFNYCPNCGTDMRKDVKDD